MLCGKKLKIVLLAHQRGHKVHIRLIFGIFFYGVRLLVGSRLKFKPQTAHWTTFYEKWKVENQENTNTSHPLSVLPRWKKKKKMRDL